MQLRPGTALLSDIVVNHVETFYGSATPTLAALSDLVELCQAAVINESLIASPSAYDRSSLLQQLDFVEVPRPEASEPDEPGAPGSGPVQESITIDVNEEGRLFSEHPLGRLLLTYVASERLQSDPMFWSLTNPDQLETGVDKGLYFLEKLPVFLFMLQARKRVADFDSEETRLDLLSRFDDSLAAYDDFASRLLELHEVDGVDVVFSTIEQPLADALKVDRAVEAVEATDLRARLHTKAAELLTADREQFFKEWELPALGLMVLGQARKLKELPREICRARDIFLTLRSELATLQRRKYQALNAGGGLDDRHYREARRIDQNLSKALAEFERSISEHRMSPDIKRAETVFNMPKYLSWLMSFGLGSLAEVLELLNLKRRNYMGYVPGLSRAASFIKKCDSTFIADIIERRLGYDLSALGMQRLTLDLAMHKSRLYSRYADGCAPADDDVFTMGIEDDQVEIPHSRFWFLMLRDENIMRGFLHPLADLEKG